jgi:UDP-N-acetylglucosamine 3-dehydrogenase
MGRQHARVLSLLPQFQLVAGVDPSPLARSHVAKHFDITTYASPKEAVAAGLDAVVVASPTASHFAVTSALLKAGIDVLVEKPVTSTVEEAISLAHLAADRGRVLMVGHIERYNPAVGALKAILDKGVLGEVVSVVGRRVGFAQPRDDYASVILDLAIHDLDIVRYLLGRDGKVVYANTLTTVGRHGPDHVDIGLRFGNAFTHLQANWITPVKMRGISVTGTSGFAELDFVAQTINLYERAQAPDGSAAWNLYDAVKKARPSLSPIEIEEPLVLELRDFLRCVDTRETPLADIESATVALALAESAAALAAKD